MALDKIYICGKITGLDKRDCWNNFFIVEQALIKEGYSPINPLRINGINSIEDYLNHKKKDWHLYLRNDILHLLECNKIAVMKNYKNSKGANLELHIAKELGFEIIYL